MRTRVYEISEKTKNKITVCIAPSLEEAMQFIATYNKNNKSTKLFTEPVIHRVKPDGNLEWLPYRR